MNINEIAKLAEIKPEDIDNPAKLKSVVSRQPDNLYALFLLERAERMEKARTVQKAFFANATSCTNLEYIWREVLRLIQEKPGSVCADGNSDLASLVRALQLIPRDDLIPVSFEGKHVGFLGMKSRCTVSFTPYYSEIFYAVCYHLSQQGKGAAAVWKWLIQGAESGQKNAQYYVGLAGMTGHAAGMDQATAFKWLLGAAKQGLVDAEYDVGACYEAGRGVAVSRKQAQKWYGRAASHHHAKAAQALKALTGNDKQANAPKEKEEKKSEPAQKQPAAPKKNTPAPNPPKAAPKQSKEAPTPQSAAKTANKNKETAAADPLAAAVKKYLTTVKTGEKAAIKEANQAIRDPERMAAIGRAYETGTDIQQDKNSALNWYLKALKAGHSSLMNTVQDPTVIFAVGRAYETGTGIERNVSKAASWLQRAADAGNQKAKAAIARPEIQKAVQNAEAKTKPGQETKPISKANAVDFLVSQYLNAVQSGNEKETEQAIKQVEEADTAPQAMFLIGNAYETGSNVRRDPKNAVFWYRKAAEAGNPAVFTILRDPDILYAIGKAYQKGDGVAVSIDNAAIWFLKAEEAGYKQEIGAFKKPRFMFSVGKAFETGTGVKKDTDQAVSWYLKAAAANGPTILMGIQNSEILLAIGDAYKTGTRIKQNDEVATCCYLKAADAGNAKAQGIVRKPEIQFAIAKAFETGTYLSPKTDKAAEYYLKAAGQGHPKAKAMLERPELQYAVAHLHLEGDNQAPGSRSAYFDWLTKAAENGYPSAMYELGCAYEAGITEGKNLPLAEKWIRKAAERSDVKARKKLETDAEFQYQLGYAYENGLWTQRDIQAAKSWYKKAAASGQTEANRRLTLMRTASEPAFISACAAQLISFCAGKAESFPVPSKELEEATPEEFYDLAVQADQAQDGRKAILFYAWAAEKGSKKALCTLINMGAPGSLYFFDYPLNAAPADKAAGS